MAFVMNRRKIIYAVNRYLYELHIALFNLDVTFSDLVSYFRASVKDFKLDWTYKLHSTFDVQRQFRAFTCPAHIFVNVFKILSNINK